MLAKNKTKPKTVSDVIHYLKWVDIEKALIRLTGINVEDQEDMIKLKSYKKIYWEIYNLQPTDMGEFQLVLSKHSLGYRIFIPNMEDRINPIMQGNWEGFLGLRIAEPTEQKLSKPEIAAMVIESMCRTMELRKKNKRDFKKFEDEYEILFTLDVGEESEIEEDTTE